MCLRVVVYVRLCGRRCRLILIVIVFALSHVLCVCQSLYLAMYFCLPHALDVYDSLIYFLYVLTNDTKFTTNVKKCLSMCWDLNS